jgi:hypothetical protein
MPTQMTTHLMHAGYVNKLITGRSPSLSVSVCVALYTIAGVAERVSMMGLLYTLCLLAFSLPKLYELRKAEIDAVVDKAREQLTYIYDKCVGRKEWGRSR